MSLGRKDALNNRSSSLLWRILPSPPSPQLRAKHMTSHDTLQKTTVEDVNSASKSHFRWIALSMLCFAMLSIYYCYDNPAALQNQILDTYNLTSVQYNTLYSIYALPNIIIPFFGGVLTDMLGPRTTVIVFFLCVMLGQGLFAIGASIGYYSLMVAGRCLFGIGSETFGVAQCPLIFSYFRGVY